MEGSTALSEWRKTRRLNTLNSISVFYEKLARSLTGGTQPNDYAEGDLVVEVGSDLIGIEVKGSGNNNPFRVEWGQLLTHKEQSKRFPYSGYFYYMLFGYAVKESRVEATDRFRRHVVRAMFEKGQGDRFLARKTNCLWLIPLPVLEHFKEEVGLRNRAFPAQEDTLTLTLGRLFLADMVDGGGDCLSQDGWRVRTGKMNRRFRINGNRFVMNFPVTTFVHENYPEIPLRGVQWEKAPP